MIGVTLLSPSEMSISSYTEEQLPMWKMSLKDYRGLEEIGKTGLDIFDLGHSEIEPIYLNATVSRNGTTTIHEFKARMSNGDLIEYKMSQIYSLLERDSLQGIIPISTVRINGDLINSEKLGYHSKISSFDSLLTLYKDYWIPSNNENVPETFSFSDSNI